MTRDLRETTAPTTPKISKIPQATKAETLPSCGRTS